MKYTSTDLQPAETVVPAIAPLPSRVPVRAYSPLQMHFLARLQRLEDVRRQMEMIDGSDPFMKKLVGRGLFATYRECVDEGVGSEARVILKI